MASASPIPKQPTGTTFIVAMTVLAAVAVIQVLAVVPHVMAAIRQQVSDSARRSEAPASVAETPTPNQVAAQASASSAIDSQAVQQLLLDANSKYRVGDFEAALKVLDDVSAMTSGDPQIMLPRAQVLERMDRYEEAILAYEGALKSPSIAPTDRAGINKKIDQLEQLLGGAAPDRPAPSGATALAPSGGAVTELRDAIGLRPGAQLGIVDVRQGEGKKGTLTFQVSVKSRPGTMIDTKDLQIRIYFYEELEDGTVTLTESKVSSQWLSPPIDWADNEPELVEVQYILPDSGLPGSAAANGSTGRKYYGYMIGVYYGNDLQDFRASPGDLVRTFPLPLVLGE